MRHAARLLPGLAALALAAAVWAAPPPPVDQTPTWASLSAAQQNVLAPLQRDWPSLDSGRKQKWLEVARRFPQLPAAERQRIQERMTEWARMTPAERGRARLQFQEARRLSPEERQARWEEYKALPDERRKELAQRVPPPPKPTPAPAERRSADVTTAKRNTVSPEAAAPAKQVAPTLVQAKPGVTTTLMTAKRSAPAHQQAGLPKIAATRGFVDPNTMLPQRGPQGAAVTPVTVEADPHP
jgi:hypothetical protein